MADEKNPPEAAPAAEDSEMPVSYSLETLPVSIESEMQRSYLDYAMSVIVGRALPDVRDGFKPVHRRVLFSMHQLGNTFSRPTKKCARVVGDVIGKYHPHGDQAAYMTLVRLGQDFAMRYPLVAKQGNYGSIDGDGPAAMRYTECRLSKIADSMLEGLDEDTVDFGPNFDNTEKEPLILPALLPNLLVNGAVGIAVGMATNIPPHNLGETVDACRHLLHHPEATVEDLIARMPAPDFPTGGIIYGLDAVHEGYRTGRGRVIIRSHVHFEEMRNGRQALVVDDIPYQVNKKALVESIARLMRDRRIEGISELRDESAQQVRIVMELKAGTFGEVLLNNLYKLTALQSSFGMNMVALVDGQPRLLNLREIIEAYLAHRREVVTRRTMFRLNKKRMEGHILEGQAVALSNLDEMLALIRGAPTPAVARTQLLERGWESELVSRLLAQGGSVGDFRPAEIEPGRGPDAEGRYWLSSVQAENILQMALRRLTGLEQDKIRSDYQSAHAAVADLLDILARPERIVAIMDEELRGLREEYADPRRSEIDRSSDPNFNPLDFVAAEDMVVTLTHAGYVKRMSLAEYQEQRRGGQGKKAAGVRDGDVIEQVFVANTHDKVLCFSDKGRVYSLDVYLLPEGSRTNKGKAIVNLLPLQEGERITILLPKRAAQENHFVFMATRKGFVKKTPFTEFASVLSTGKIAIGLEEGDELAGVAISDGTQDVLLVASNGKASRFSETEVRPMGRTARGVRSMILKGAEVIGMMVIDETKPYVLTASEFGYGKRTPVEEYVCHGRRTQGLIAMQVTEKTGRLVAAAQTAPDEGVILLTSAGKVVRTPSDTIRICGRLTQGVKLVEMPGGAVLTRVVPVEDAEEPGTPPAETETASGTQEPGSGS